MECYVEVYVVSKGKVVPVCAMKAHRGSRGVALFIFNLGARYR
jgi:hypothetical protein